MSSPLELARISLKGDRKINQDRCLTLQVKDDTLLALADGLGGHPRGEVAAQLLTDTCEHLFRSAPHPITQPLDLIASCLERAHAAIVRFGIGQKPPIAPRTTGVVCLVQGNQAWWSHVGDSRLYLFREGRLVERTRDHRRRRESRGRTKITITRCLGGMKLPPGLAEHGPISLQPGDILLLSSDGFWGGFSSNELAQRLYQPGELMDNLQQLAEEACQNAHPRSDNTSAIALRWWPATEPALGRRPLRKQAKTTA